jgi:tetratricopeptide (TPR) repeat protein
MIGQLDEAAEQLLQAFRISPQDVSVQRKLAFIRMTQGNASAAIQRFTNVLKARPHDVACWYNLANAYRADGQLEQAMKVYRHTLKIQPQMTLAANNLAWILATHPQAEMRDGAEAVMWAEQVCEQTNHAEPSFLDTLACAYAENGQFDKAVATAAQAIQLLTENGQAAEAANIQARLDLFRQQQPYRAELR